MDSAVGYLVSRFFYRFSDFFHHWYIDASRRFFHKQLSFLERLDRTLAIRITVKYFFQPLYKDYTIVGRILGVIFRSGRILIGLVTYTIVILLFLALYFVWVSVLPLILIYAIRHL